MARNALKQPVLWVALAVLLVNDHALKGAGLIPGWLTGKLSDFAWMVVAPAFSAALFGLRDRRAIAAWIGGFAVLFAATELSPAAAQAVCRAAALLGVPCRLWADPTDLIALSVLPVTWHVMTQTDGEPGPRSVRAPLLRLGMGLGIFASIATTNPPPRDPTWTTGAFVLNRTGGSLEVRVRWTSAAIECEALDGVPLERAVSGVIFDTAITYRLAPDETVPLEHVDPMSPTVTLPPTGRCQLALVAVDGASDTIVVVPADTVMARATQVGATDVPGRAVEIAVSGARLSIAPGDELAWGLRDDRAWATDCTEVRPALGLSWSGPPTQVLTSRRLGADGCTELVLSEGRAFVCAPEALVPFAEGDELVHNDASSIDHDEQWITGPAGRLVVVAWTRTALTIDDVRVAWAAPETCDGVRLNCGAYVQPLEVEVAPATAEGAFFRSPAGVLVALGASEHTVIAPEGCDPTHRRTGATISYAALVP